MVWKRWKGLQWGCCICSDVYVALECCCEEGANYNLIQSNFSQSIFQHHLFGFWAHSFRLGEKSGEELLLLHIKRSVSKGVLWHLIRIIPGRLPVEVFKARQTWWECLCRASTLWRDYILQCSPEMPLSFPGKSLWTSKRWEASELPYWTCNEGEKPPLQFSRLTQSDVSSSLVIISKQLLYFMQTTWTEAVKGHAISYWLQY